MCGIVGYIGNKEAHPILLNSLKRLEYRGYDSCGIAVLHGKLQIYKDAGKVEKLEKALPPGRGKIGIGHTRWATHGKPCAENAHPHRDCSGKIAVVHNGVITNFHKLKEELIAEGHQFCSETDTEVMPHLIEKYYQGDLEEAVRRALQEVRGSYALIVLHEECEQLVAARKECPLILGIGDKENFIASDVPAVLDYTDRVIYLEDDDFTVVTKERVRITNNGKGVTRTEHRIPWSVEEAEKSGYEHFMLKEIHEQPRVIRDTFRGYLSSVEPVIDLGIAHRGEFEDIIFIACGTSYHAALIGKHLIEKLTRTPARVELASEFNYSDVVLRKTWAVGITQSGETADTLRALKKARELGCETMAITNVVGSSVTRIANQIFYIRAGPEISVAATKSFVGQLIALYLLALSSATVDVRTRDRLITELRLLPNRVQRLLDEEASIAQCGKFLSGYENVFFVARGINLPVALEGALKLKEISYIHAEGYAVGELKHGPFALLTPHTPVVAVATQDNTYEVLLANLKEIKARESPLLALAEEGDREIEKFVDFIIRVPQVDPLFSPVVNAVALQLLAYYTAKERGCPIDQPRNLAKSVTVE
jgi:glucosamine--fructose-6-phosphate aminotransferase (isomerizing)